VKVQKSPSPTRTSALKDRVAKFAAEFDTDPGLSRAMLLKMHEIDNLFVELGKHWEGLDGLVHSIAYAPSEAIEGDFLDGITRDAFRIAHDVSSYSYAGAGQSRTPDCC
jgi:enoyl-[acyl-carrier protein] reductase I